MRCVPLTNLPNSPIAVALGDDSLTLAYWATEQQAYVDAEGRRVELPTAGSGRWQASATAMAAARSVWTSSAKMARSGSTPIEALRSGGAADGLTSPIPAIRSGCI